MQQFDGDALDASTLLMPLVFFVSPTDPRMLRTIDAINRPPQDGGLVSDGLVFRYDVEKTPDGLKGTEGTFNLCTFWLVEALTRASSADPKRLRQSPPAVRADARIRESSGPVRGADRASGPGARQFPAGAHASGVDQRGVQSGSLSGWAAKKRRRPVVSVIRHARTRRRKTEQPLRWDSV